MIRRLRTLILLLGGWFGRARWRVFWALRNPHDKEAFLRQLPSDASVLDVGCGNDSPRQVKSVLPHCRYTGLDIQDYNQASAHLADEYVLTDADSFTEAIVALGARFDAVISSHNLEHCDDRTGTLDAMIAALRPGGRLYLSFPCGASVTFPTRMGTLNYYDDASHKGLPPDFDAVTATLGRAGLLIDVAHKRYRPLYGVLAGLIQERKSRRSGVKGASTWALYGFESIIWARRP